MVTEFLSLECFNTVLPKHPVLTGIMGKAKNPAVNNKKNVFSMSITLTLIILAELCLFFDIVLFEFIHCFIMHTFLLNLPSYFTKQLFAPSTFARYH